MMTKESTRAIVLDILLEVMEKGKFTHIVLRQALDKYGYLEKNERAFISRLANGTIEKCIELDYIINGYSSVKVNKMKPVIRNILRMTVYQLKYMDSVPASAACNEAVKLAQKKGFGQLKGFINGVSRNISRHIEEMVQYDDLSVKYSMPDWLVKFWMNSYGEGKTVDILEGLSASKDQYHETVVRCNLSKNSAENIITSLENDKVSVRRDPILPYALHISNFDRLDCLAAFKNGEIQAQDISSMLVGEIASPQKNDYCIDVCAAPGGKSLHLADKLDGTGTVDSRDVSYEKIYMIEENISRCGFKNIHAQVKDALDLDVESIHKADIVLADLPCSGLGIIGNKPDIKYKMSLDKMKQLASLQREILSVVQQYVKPGKLLIYSTCTINPEENEENVKWFLNSFPYELVSIEKEIGKELKCETTNSGYIQLIPGLNKTAGFFIAKLRRKTDE